MVAHRDPADAFALGTKPYLVLPAAVRQCGGLRSGDQVLVVADANHDVLVVHPLRALNAMIVVWLREALVDSGNSLPQVSRGCRRSSRTVLPYPIIALLPASIPTPACLL